uniref:Ig-like domain-containing protein n=1 Tax=Amphimedon queenslandica TaxID=400682 RepID=A0A1X7TYX6_AMPQE
MALNGLFLCLQFFLWYSSAEQLNEPNFEQDDDNTTMKVPVILQNPFLYYLDYKTVYVNCSVYGESPFEVSWLYSTDEISNRSSDYTIISGSKVSNIVYSPNSDDEGYVWWNSSLLLNPINNSTAGYYYCRVNTSFGLNYSKPVYVRSTYLPRLNSTRFVKSGQAYVNFLALSFTERKVTFSCLCAECDGIKWRKNNIPIPKSSYGVVALKKELWPSHSINLKHSTLSTSYYDSYLHSCQPVYYQNDIFENSQAYIDVPYARIIKRPEASTYVPGETLTQKCSARSLYPMTVTWQESEFLFPIKDKIDSRKTEGLYNILNSTISVNISVLTPLLFYLRCRFTTTIYYQPDNFTKIHHLSTLVSLISQ